MKTRSCVLFWAAGALAAVLLPAPAQAVYYYSTINVFGGEAVGTSITEIDIYDYYNGYRPYVEGTLKREWDTLASDSLLEEYDTVAWLQLYASTPPGNASYTMEGLHYAWLDWWNMYYLGSSQAWFYYYDPAAQPPYIYGLNPNVGVSGVDGYIEIYGAYLWPPGTTPQISMDGATLYVVYSSDNQINVYYSYVSLGTHYLSVTTIYGTSNYVQFTASTGDPTPVINLIDPDEWDAGETTDFAIQGTGFGTNPSLTITGGWIEDYGVYQGWDTGMNAWVRVSPDAPDQTVEVTVTSNGYWGHPFMQQYPNQPRSGSRNAQTRAAPAGCAVPVNFQQVGLGTDTGNGTLHFAYSWGSSTGNVAHLAGCVMQERVVYPGGHPYTFPSPPYPANSTVPNPTFMQFPPTTGYAVDNHETPGAFVKPYAFSPISAIQVYRYRCNCYQGGNWQVLAGPLNLYRQVTNTLFPGVWVFQVCKDNVSPESSYSCAIINPLP